MQKNPHNLQNKRHKCHIDAFLHQICGQEGEKALGHCEYDFPLILTKKSKHSPDLPLGMDTFTVKYTW